MTSKLSLTCRQTYDQNYAKMLEELSIDPNDVSEGLQILLYSFYGLGFSEGGKRAINESKKVLSEFLETGGKENE